MIEDNFCLNLTFLWSHNPSCDRQGFSFQIVKQRSVEKETLLGLLSLEVLAEHDVGQDKGTDDSEEQRVVEFLINHVESTVRADARQEKVVAVGEHLRSGLKAGRERVQVLKTHEGQVVRDVTHIEGGDYGVVHWVPVALELELHGLLNILLLEGIGVGESKPASRRLDLVRVESARGEALLRELEELVLGGDEDKGASSDVVGSLGEGEGLDSEGQDVVLAQNDRVTFLGKRRIALRGDALLSLKVVSDQLLGVAFLLVAVEFNDGEFLLADSR